MWVDGAYTTGSGSNPDRPQIYYHSYTYNKASDRLTAYDQRPGINQTSYAQKLSYKYDYDELHRLKDVDRGYETPGSPPTWTTGLDGQTFTFDLIDNWSKLETDFNGDGSYSTTSGGETDTRTHSNVNALTNQNTAPDSSDRDLSYDKNGSLREVKDVSPGTNVYWKHTYDAWNRLVKVEKRANNGTLRTLAQYQYNALNWRVIKRDNTNLNTDGDLDEQTVLYYNERWQLLREEIYDNWTEASPGSVDRHTNLIYGFDHIDQVVTRVYNDGTTTRPYYHLHDPQYSTVVVLDTAAKIVERIDYSAFGFARHHHFGDVNGDGSGPDLTAVTTISAGSPAIGNTNYHAEADLDRSGVVDGTDVLLANVTFKAAIRAGEVSDRGTCANDIGYCGYVFNTETFGNGHYSVRFRDYHPQRGRWLQRDPIDYASGNANLYNYVGDNPVGWIDPLGLFEQFSDKFYSSDPTQFGSTGGLSQSSSDVSTMPIAHGSAAAGILQISEIWLGPPLIIGYPKKMTYEEYQDEKSREWLGVIHNVLDAVGMVPGFGAIADLVNGIIYVWEGDHTNAMISFAATVVDGVIVLKHAGKVIGHAQNASEAANICKNAVKNAKNALEGVGCFVAGTLVSTSAGSVPIENICAGDKVWSFNNQTQEWELCDVRDVTMRVYLGDIVVLEIEYNGGCETLEATGGHPFWVNDGEALSDRPRTSELPAEEPRLTASGRWVDAQWLQPGDKLILRNGSLGTIAALTVRTDRLLVYNLNVSRLHNHAVGSAGLLVHNLTCSEILARNMTGSLDAARRMRQKGLEAAHLIPVNGWDDIRWDAVEELHGILKTHGLDVNSSFNGAWLPAGHKPTHQNAFLLYLVQELSGQSAGTLKNTLKKIGQQLQNGTFELPGEYLQ